MKDTQKETNIDLSAILSFSVFILSGILFGFTVLSNHLLPYLGIDLNRILSGFEIIILFLGASIALVVIIYISVIAWLIVSRFLLTPSSVWKVARIGRLSKFDCWLITLLVGDEPKP